jgi:hypothetical protein
MNLAAQIAAYREMGFTSEQAEVITLMRVASGVLLRDFPDSFLLFGGATLLLSKTVCATPQIWTCSRERTLCRHQRIFVPYGRPN